MNDIEKNFRKGTTTVGIMCKDGIVLAADKRVTLGGGYISHKKFEKVYKITDNMALTIAGMVSDVQLITKLIKAQISLKKLRTGKDVNVKETANLLGAIVYQNIRKFSPIPGITAFLLGGIDDEEGFSLYELAPDGSIVKHDEYVTDGSGMEMAIGVLDTLYKKGMSVQEGITLSIKAINAAIQRDTASGEGVDVVTITKTGAKKVLTKEIDTTIKA